MTLRDVSGSLLLMAGKVAHVMVQDSGSVLPMNEGCKLPNVFYLLYAHELCVTISLILHHVHLNLLPLGIYRCGGRRHILYM